MLISRDLTKAMNAQIGHELAASLQYLTIAGHFERQQLALLAKLFFKQADEERDHALKFVRYLLDTGGDLKIPTVPAPKATFASAEEAVKAALTWEQEVTSQIGRLMDLAASENDHLAQNFLRWFVDEQLEEVKKMDQLASVIRRAGEKNLLMVEAYLAHLDTGE